jgi:hypothetical protein
LAVAGVCLAIALSGQYRRHQAHRTAEILRAMLGSEVRFQKVRVSVSTNGHVALHGSVASDADLRALRTLIEGGHLPMQPMMSVEVDTHPPNQGAAAPVRVVQGT